MALKDLPGLDEAKDLFVMGEVPVKVEEYITSIGGEKVSIEEVNWQVPNKTNLEELEEKISEIVPSVSTVIPERDEWSDPQVDAQNEQDDKELFNEYKAEGYMYHGGYGRLEITF